ncbi:hypothetical protein IC608_11190 [Devosia sp. PTR5]|uniref:Nucleotidyltransferase n=1 Tax=Devosia oryzisoli TaxID=2774138 RepID=A0A927FV21_9HYPH|nr:hypothetical protein [Devosia oryzisoli]MBD8066037.1 hypothetical protein [Devosia oryzisoli]
MSALPHRSDARTLLRKRAHYFFSTARKRRSEVAAFAADLEKLGETVAIGGFLRDLHLNGNRHFSSDVDFVVNPHSLTDFERMMRSMDAVRNRFGGYAIQQSRWKVEVWPLALTWASVEKYVDVRSISDLLKVTFFTWDSVLYSVSHGRIITTEDYFDNVGKRLLDVNLRPNPNPVGNAVRAIRYAHKWRAAIGKQLAIHIAQQVKDVGWDQLAKYERQSFPQPILAFLDGESIQSAIDKFIEADEQSHQLFGDPAQLTLALGALSSSPESERH